MEPLFVGMGTYTLDNLIEVFKARRVIKNVILSVVLGIVLVVEGTIIAGGRAFIIIYYERELMDYLMLFLGVFLMYYGIKFLIKIKNGAQRGAEASWKRNLATYQRDLEEEYIFFEEYFVMHDLCSNATLNFEYWKIRELRETEHTFVIIVEGGANALIEKSRFVLGHPFAFREFILAKAVNAKIKF